jgi:hypothetical protein
MEICDISVLSLFLLSSPTSSAVVVIYIVSWHAPVARKYKFLRTMAKAMMMKITKETNHFAVKKFINQFFVKKHMDFWQGLSIRVIFGGSECLSWTSPHEEL